MGSYREKPEKAEESMEKSATESNHQNLRETGMESALREPLGVDSDPEEIAKKIATLNSEIARGAAEHVASQISENPWFHGQPDRVRDLIERVIIVAHYRMSGGGL
jgi:uncharacterized small protein (DUF1192 family)